MADFTIQNDPNAKRTKEIKQLYKDYLYRDPSAQDVTDYLKSPSSYEDRKNQILGSDERKGLFSSEGNSLPGLFSRIWDQVNSGANRATYDQRARTLYNPQIKSVYNQIAGQQSTFGKLQQAIKNNQQNQNSGLLQQQQNLGLLRSGMTAAGLGDIAKDTNTALNDASISKQGVIGNLQQAIARLKEGKVGYAQNLQDQDRNRAIGDTNAMLGLQNNSFNQDVQRANIAGQLPVGQSFNVGGQQVNGMAQPNVSPQIVNIGGRQKLIDANTGREIADLGEIPQSFSPASTGRSGGYDPGAYNWTPTQTNNFQAAGITDPSAQAVFLNTPAAFQDLWIRNVQGGLAGGGQGVNFTAQDILTNYNSWLASQGEQQNQNSQFGF